MQDTSEHKKVERQVKHVYTCFLENFDERKKEERKTEITVKPKHKKGIVKQNIKLEKKVILDTHIPTPSHP